MEPSSQPQTSDATPFTGNSSSGPQTNSAGPIPTKKPKFGPRPSKRSFPSNGKRSLARFEKQKDPSLTFTYPLLTYFSYHTCFLGASILPRILYDILEARDHKMTTMFSKRDLQYVTLLATYLRTARIVSGTNTTIVHGLSLLKDSISNLLLPDVLCQYIESIGIVSCTSNIKLVPVFGTYRYMQQQTDFIDAIDYLHYEEQLQCLEGWPINDEVIQRVQMGLSRALKGVFELRKVKDELEGQECFLASYVEMDERLQPRSCQQIDANSCALGACFRFREADENGYVGLKLPQVHEAPLVQPDIHLTQWVLKQLKQ